MKNIIQAAMAVIFVGILGFTVDEVYTLRVKVKHLEREVKELQSQIRFDNSLPPNIY